MQSVPYARKNPYSYWSPRAFPPNARMRAWTLWHRFCLKNTRRSSLLRGECRRCGGNYPLLWILSWQSAGYCGYVPKNPRYVRRRCAGYGGSAHYPARSRAQNGKPDRGRRLWETGRGSGHPFYSDVESAWILDTKDPYKVELAMRKLLPPEESNDFCHRCVLHGRACCTARKAMCEGAVWQNFAPKKALCNNSIKGKSLIIPFTYPA